VRYRSALGNHLTAAKASKKKVAHLIWDSYDFFLASQDLYRLAVQGASI
jgi:hypothetical protein